MSDYDVLLMNVVYYTFLACMAYFVTPLILLLLILLPGFVSQDTVTVEHADTTVEIARKTGELSRSDIEAAVERAQEKDA